jgi:hypothetical protein
MEASLDFCALDTLPRWRMPSNSRPRVKEHMVSLAPRERSALLDAIEQRLVDQPLTETRNRKPLRPNPLAPWELRGGKLRQASRSLAEYARELQSRHYRAHR